jgi:asparagine synthase (glutamine-hydrolysing)
VAQHLGAEHHEIEASADLVKLLPRLVRQYDQPFADLAALPTLVLSEVTRQHVTVALNGDGGDETFAGYDRYAGAPHWRAFQRLPRVLQAGGLWKGAAAVAHAIHPRAGERISRLYALGSEALDQHYARSMSHFNPEWLGELLSDELRARADGWDAWQPLRTAFAEARRLDLGPLDTLLSVDTATYLPDCLLVKVDIASMAYGLEVRSPLLDHEVVELAARLPEALKRRGSEPKHLLKRLARKHLPASVVDRPKSGFGVPLAMWLRTDLRELLRDLLLDGRLARRGHFRPRVVESLVQDHLVHGKDRAAMLWNLLVLEMWQREVLEGGA